MARKYVVVSDLTGDPILDDSQAVSIAVLTHPDMEQPVQLDASMDEVKGLLNQAKPSVVLEIVGEGGDYRERIVVDLEDFNSAFKVEDIQTVLEEADGYAGGVARSAPAVVAPSRGRIAAKSATEKTDYTATENYGLKHRGRTTDAEAELVRSNLDQANANRRREGQEEISLDSPKDVERYGLQDLLKGGS